MLKQCTCGQRMNIRLRTLIFQINVEIENVPIYSCVACSKSEVFFGVKFELVLLIAQLSKQPVKQHLYFNETCELAHLMMVVSDKEFNNLSVEEILDNRINELLDLLLLAKSLDDESWILDVHNRLIQISQYSLSTYDFS